jgi:hypothetical protein
MRGFCAARTLPNSLRDRYSHLTVLLASHAHKQAGCKACISDRIGEGLSHRGIIRGAMADEQTIRALAEQAYLFHLLVRVLHKNGKLDPGQPVGSWNEVEFQQFLSDYRRHHFPNVES